MKLLAIESTCDETAVAIVTERLDVLGSAVASQDLLHERFGGVVPEIASRAHLERMLPLVDEVLKQSQLRLAQIDAIAVCNTPGLAGSLLVGLAAAKAFCVALGKPLIAVNHVEAHLYACQFGLSESIFPCAGLVVSGGHSSLYRADSPQHFELLGATIDDAAGEAFDKVASLLGLPYPGGPAIQRAADHGDPRRHRLPRAFINDDRLDFSFSGLKTAVRYQIWPQGTGKPLELNNQAVADLAASFQEAVVDVLVAKSIAALHKTGLSRLCVGGGVAANSRLRQRLTNASEQDGFELHLAPLHLTTDNAVMSALAVEHFKVGRFAALDLDVHPTLR